MTVALCVPLEICEQIQQLILDSNNENDLILYKQTVSGSFKIRPTPYYFQNHVYMTKFGIR